MEYIFISVDDNNGKEIMIPLEVSYEEDGVTYLERCAEIVIISAEDWLDEVCGLIAASGCGYGNALEDVTEEYCQTYGGGGFILSDPSCELKEEFLVYFNEVRLDSLDEGDGPWYSEEPYTISNFCFSI